MAKIFIIILDERRSILKAKMFAIIIQFFLFVIILICIIKYTRIINLEIGTLYILWVRRKLTKQFFFFLLFIQLTPNFNCFHLQRNIILIIFG